MGFQLTYDYQHEIQRAMLGDYFPQKDVEEIFSLGSHNQFRDVTISNDEELE